MRIDDYVAELERTLAGPHGPKRDLVVEARDSLVDAAEALEAEGMSREEAERRAVEEFGPVPAIAPAYQVELTVSAGRRLGLLMLISLPALVLMWGAIWHFQPAAATQWSARPGWYMTASRLLDVLQLAAGLYGGLALLALGRGTRWVSPRLVTRSLGLAVWLMLPLTALLGTLLSDGTPVTDSPAFPAMALANLVTCAFAGLQLYCATRCVMLSRRA